MMASRKQSLGEIMVGDVVATHASPMVIYEESPGADGVGRGTMVRRPRVKLELALEATTVGIEHHRGSSRLASKWHKPRALSLALTHGKAGELLELVAGVLGEEMTGDAKLAERRRLATAVVRALDCALEVRPLGYSCTRCDDTGRVIDEGRDVGPCDCGRG